MINIDVIVVAGINDIRKGFKSKKNNPICPYQKKYSISNIKMHDYSWKYLMMLDDVWWCLMMLNDAIKQNEATETCEGSK